MYHIARINGADFLARSAEPQKLKSILCGLRSPRAYSGYIMLLWVANTDTVPRLLDAIQKPPRPVSLIPKHTASPRRNLLVSVGRTRQGTNGPTLSRKRDGNGCELLRLTRVFSAYRMPNRGEMHHVRYSYRATDLDTYTKQTATGDLRE